MANGFADRFAVGGVGYTEPRVGGGEHPDGSPAIPDKPIDGGGEKELGLWVGSSFSEKRTERAFEQGEEGGGEAPDIHRDGFVSCETKFLALRVFGAGAASISRDVGIFRDTGQEAIGGYTADAAGDRSVVGKRIAEGIGGQGEMGGEGGSSGEKLGEQTVSVSAIEVVGIDDGERGCNGGAG